jgi:L-aminopeptidase/D-esterase-like protein
VRAECEALGAVLLVAAATMLDAQVTTDPSVRGLTAVPGIKVGHHTLTERPTGCTVIIAEGGAVGGVDVRGAAPGTRETDLMDPVNSVERVNAIVLAGGSAFGLDAASGVMRFLEERHVGFAFGSTTIPIVPAAVLFDLQVGDPSIRPTADCGYQAARRASDAAVAEGNVGAGAGATAGKVAGRERAMKSGIGTAAVATPQGLIVAALVAANPYGSIVDPASGQVVAGARTADGKGLLPVSELSRLLQNDGNEAPENTTLGVIATNARLSKAQARKVAQMAHDGVARAIYPAHTPVDGDAIFTLATGSFEGKGDVMVVGTLAAQVMTEAILRAARSAAGIPGYPAARDLAR